MKQQNRLIRLHEKDNVLIALGDVGPGEVTLEGGETLTLASAVSMGHKVAAGPISQQALIVKYGMPIGIATANIAMGEHVHLHNISSRYTATHYREDEAGYAHD